MEINHEAILTQFPDLEWEEDTQSLIVPPEKAVEVVTWLKEHPEMRLDFLSCVSGVDYPAKEVKTKARNEEGKMEITVTQHPEKMEVVYHFYSMEKKIGPLVLKQRVMSRENSTVTSLTPIYRGADLMEREVFDLFGINFTDHPDLRRILMWDNFEHHPMRKDYTPPNDYDYEPTPHDDVIERAQEREKEREGQEA
ncbi:MAG: NADH-quinone oxidoreductase subunit C [Opitutales bacterium]|jgi:NADH-quinone oxidoreductase subunit C|nr:NADH-quinone oxidoreductase subunit C [bacterium]MDG2169481.1 NADH-quinone oxidoreductase subunit C [Opitutales bacterium]